ncbi:hypothetical protein LTR01_001999 [Friedmanniomyces endolithicus]|nr:hypothetical protein LTR01_001999 [Friedmanniomyces endolithicus]KAK0830530.1 hypothetical protein LTR73_003809 [Friedmanniomyces endolithicus]
MAHQSAHGSPADSGLAKGEDHVPKREEVEDERDDEDGGMARPRDAEAQRPDLYLRARSSARSARSAHSHRSYTDGYVHFGPNEDKKGTGEGGDVEETHLVQFDGDTDPDSPRNRTTARKWFIVVILAGSAMCVTCASALYTSTYLQLERDFHISREVATLGLTTFVCGLGLGPMFLSPLSEFYGRRIIYLVAFGMYLIWLIPCAVAQNAATMLVVRFFDGLAGSAFLSVAGGTVGDMFPREKLSGPMMIYTASPFVGPQLGPVIGGFINQFADWRWSFWVLIIWAAVQWTLIFFFVPETYAPVLLRRKAIKLRKETGDDRWIAPIEKMNKCESKG